MTILLLLGVVVISYIIWISSTGISGASEMWGCGWSPGVRGATINAIASSLPELFTTVVFLIILGDSEGFVSGMSTIAGSSVFNALVIPGVMILTVFLKNKKSLKDHDRSLVLRDGLWLLFVENVGQYPCDHSDNHGSKHAVECKDPPKDSVSCQDGVDSGNGRRDQKRESSAFAGT